MEGNKFDLFEGLAHISKKNYDWYANLTPEGKKSASPFVIARWMTGTSDRAQLIRLNTFVNPYLFPLGAEKDLLFKLLSASATGKNVRYQWIKAPGAKTAIKLKVEVVKQFYEVSTREATLYLKNISDDDIMEMAEDLGWDKNELTQLKKEFSDESGSIKTTSPRAKKRS